MASKPKRISVVSLSLLALGLCLGPTDAGEQTLFEALFGGGIKRMQPRESPPPAKRPKVRRNAAAAPKITGPSYYSYKADQLIKVDFSPLKRVAAPVSYQPPAGEGSLQFDEAMAGFQLLSRLEGIIPALETAHAVAWVDRERARWTPDDVVLLCISGRGDKDVAQVMDMGILNT